MDEIHVDMMEFKRNLVSHAELELTQAFRGVTTEKGNERVKHLHRMIDAIDEAQTWEELWEIDSQL